MAYTNKVVAAATVATMVLFLVVTIVDAQSMPEMPKLNPVCALLNLPDIVKACYWTSEVLPTTACCEDLKSANDMQVKCLCDNFISHPDPTNFNLTKTRYDLVHASCGVSDKFACKGNANRGSTSKFAASMGLFVLVASLFF